MNGRVFEGSGSYATAGSGPVVSVGNFDGVHLGHRALLDRLRAMGREQGAPTAVLTFHPSPVEVLRPDKVQPRIQTLPERIATLLELVDHVIVEPFDRDYAAHDARWFATEVLGRRLRARAVLVGWDFKFGRDRGGDAASLGGLIDVPVEAFGPVGHGEDVISSSRIRKLVLAGEVAAAAALLGRPHRLVGEVVHGDARGRTIGFPTANLSARTALIPPHGVYAVRANVDGQSFGGVMNVGVRPTFGVPGLRIEVYILDLPAGTDLYGRDLAVDLVERLRDERKFDGIDALVAQIHADVAAARAVLG